MRPLSKHHFKTKLGAMQTAIPCWACSECRQKHDAPKHARCTGCNHTTQAMVRVQGKQMNKNCPNCARPKLKNEHIKPFACDRCGHPDFDYFHSTGEYNMFAQLALLNDNGKIKNLRRQVPFQIKFKGQPKPMRTLVLDFTFDEIDSDGEFKKRYLDYKGDEKGIDKYWKFKKELVEFMYNLNIEIITAR